MVVSPESPNMTFHICANLQETTSNLDFQPNGLEYEPSGGGLITNVRVYPRKDRPHVRTVNHNGPPAIICLWVRPRRGGRQPPKKNGGANPSVTLVVVSFYWPLERASGMPIEDNTCFDVFLH